MTSTSGYAISMIEETQQGLFQSLIPLTGRRTGPMDQKSNGSLSGPAARRVSPIVSENEQVPSTYLGPA